LRAFVSANPNSSHSLRVLFEILLQDQAFDEAKLLLSSAAHLPAVDQAVMASYWFLAVDDLEGAERVIEHLAAAVDQNTAYVSLKAGVLHKVQRYDESARAYQILLQKDQSNSAYWLGLGVAWDAMSRNSDALNAFKRALQGQKNEEVRRYISARVEALSRIQSTTGNP
jgi:tetratricopeptide (TPR) repeat protein